MTGLEGQIMDIDVDDEYYKIQCMMIYDTYIYQTSSGIAL